MPGESFNQPARSRFEVFGRRRPEGPHTGFDAAARFGDLVIVSSPQPHFVIEQTRRRVHQMGVTVDEAGHHHAATGIHLFRVPGKGQPFDFIGGAGCFNCAIANEHRPVRD